MTTIDDPMIAERMERIDQLTKERDALMAQLKSALHIEALWSEAFNNGSIKTRLQPPNETRPEKIEFVIVDGKGNEKAFPFLQVHDKYPNLTELHIRQRGDVSQAFSLPWRLRSREIALKARKRKETPPT